LEGELEASTATAAELQADLAAAQVGRENHWTVKMIRSPHQSHAHESNMHICFYLLLFLK